MFFCILVIYTTVQQDAFLRFFSSYAAYEIRKVNRIFHS